MPNPDKTMKPQNKVAQIERSKSSHSSYYAPFTFNIQQGYGIFTSNKLRNCFTGITSLRARRRIISLGAQFNAFNPRHTNRTKHLRA